MCFDRNLCNLNGCLGLFLTDNQRWMKNKREADDLPVCWKTQARGVSLSASIKEEFTIVCGFV